MSSYAASSKVLFSSRLFVSLGIALFLGGCSQSGTSASNSGDQPAALAASSSTLQESDPSSAMIAASPTASAFQPTVENHAMPPGAAPGGMAWISGGEFSMGANESPDHDEVGMKATYDARPIHRVYVDGFFMDKTDVTNAEFARFVKATGYVTVAERTPRAEDFPGAPPENLVAGSVVFSPPDHAVP